MFAVPTASRPVTHCAGCCLNRLGELGAVVSRGNQRNSFPNPANIRFVARWLASQPIAASLAMLYCPIRFAPNGPNYFRRNVHTGSGTHAPRLLRRAPNHYAALGLSPGCDQKEIKLKYYEMSKQFHPDMNSGKDAAKKFAVISEAYQVLGSADSRRQYDRDHLRTSSAGGRTGAAGTQSAYDHRQWRTSGWAEPSGDHRYGGRPMHEMDYKDFAEFQRIFRATRRAQSQAGTGSTKEYNYDAHQRAHYGSANWQEQADQMRGGTDEFSKARQEWLRKKFHKERQDVEESVRLVTLFAFLTCGFTFLFILNEMIFQVGGGDHRPPPCNHDAFNVGVYRSIPAAMPPPFSPSRAETSQSSPELSTRWPPSDSPSPTSPPKS